MADLSEMVYVFRYFHGFREERLFLWRGGDISFYRRTRHLAYMRIYIYNVCVCVFAHACGIENISLQKKLEHSYNIMYLPVIYI